MAKGSKNTGGYKKKTAVPAAETVEQNQSGTTEQPAQQGSNVPAPEEPAITEFAAPLPPPVKSVSVQSVTNECIELIQRLPRREQIEVFRSIRRGL